MLGKQTLFLSTLYALMKLFTINGVDIKAFAKLKMASHAVLLNPGPKSLNVNDKMEL